MVTNTIKPGLRTLARVHTYQQARQLVDRLSAAGFPAERVRIVGIDLYTVDRVTGRRTPLRALVDAVAGRLTGRTRDDGTGHLRAYRYDVEVEPAHADDARHILGLP